MKQVIILVLLLTCSNASPTMPEFTLSHAIEMLSDGELMSVGSLGFHLNEKEIRYVSFSSAMFEPHVQVVMKRITLQKIEPVSDDVLIVSGNSRYGFPVMCRIEKQGLDPQFEITIQGRSKITIRNLSRVGEAYRRKYIPKVYLGKGQASPRAHGEKTEETP